MFKYFLKYFAYGILFVTGILGLVWFGMELGNLIAGKLGAENQNWGFVLVMGVIVLTGITTWAYDTAKMKQDRINYKR